MRISRLAKIRQRKRRTLFLVFSGIAAFLLLYYFIFLSSFFQIQDIQFVPEDSKYLSKDFNYYLLQQYHKFIPPIIINLLPQYRNKWANILFINPSGIRSFILQNHPELASVVIRKDLLAKKIIIISTKRKAQFLLCNYNENTLSNCYFVDKDGVVYSPAPLIYNSSLPVVTLPSENEIHLLSNVLSVQNWHRIYQIVSVLKKDEDLLDIKLIQLPYPFPSWINIVTTDDWILKINLQDNFSYLVEVLRQFKKQNLNDSFKSVHYIDLRFLPDIYYSQR